MAKAVVSGKLLIESEPEMSQYRFFFEIVLKETLDERWAEWFEGARLEIRAEGGTLICGEFPDQAALHGVLERVRDLNLSLVSVRVQDLSLKGND